MRKAAITVRIPERENAFAEPFTNKLADRLIGKLAIENYKCLAAVKIREIANDKQKQSQGKYDELAFGSDRFVIAIRLHALPL